MAKRKWHPSVTLERVIGVVRNSSVSLDDPGICVYCGADAEGVEPDARKHTCESCGEEGVYGADELLLMLS